MIFYSYKYYTMGTTCCNPDKNIDKGIDQLENPSTNSSLKLTNNLYLSQKFDEIFKKEKKMYAQLGSTRRQASNNTLILVAGRDFDPKLFVRFFLIYSFYIGRFNPKENQFQKIFFEIINLVTSAEQINQLKQIKVEYDGQSNQHKKDMIIVNSIFKAKSIAQNMNEILLSSNDPTVIGNLIFPLARIYHGIFKNYQNWKTRTSKPIYVVAILEDEEIKDIKNLKGKTAYFSFSIFMRGFSIEKHARAKFNSVKKQHKSGATLFIINFRPNQDKKWLEYDYGFYLNPNVDCQQQGDILFNIMNTFKVVDGSSSEYDLQYGFLPYLYESKYTDRISNMDFSSLRIFQLSNAVSNNYLKSQSCLLRMISEDDDSIRVSKSIISQSKSTSTQQSKLADIEVQNLINNHLDRNEYKEALQIAEDYKSFFLIKAKKLQILYRSNKKDEARKYLKEIMDDPAKKQNSEADEIIELIAARLQIEEEKTKKAKQRLRKLHDKMIIKYKGDYQIIGRQVISSIQKLYGTAKENPVDEQLSKSNHQNIDTIRKSNLKLTNICTTN